MQTRGYDGVDVNWEGLSSADPVDQAQFPAFIQELRQALDQISPRPLLTMPPTTGSDAAVTLVAQVAEAFDQINLQTYVMSGPYPGWVTWFNSPLFNGGFTFPSSGGPVPSADDEVSRFQSAGIPLARMAIGAQLDAAVWSGGSGTDTEGVSAPRQTWTYGDLEDPGAPSVSYLRVADALTSLHRGRGLRAPLRRGGPRPLAGARPGRQRRRPVRQPGGRPLHPGEGGLRPAEGAGRHLRDLELSGDFFPTGSATPVTRSRPRFVEPPGRRPGPS